MGQVLEVLAILDPGPNYCDSNFLKETFFFYFFTFNSFDLTC